MFNIGAYTIGSRTLLAPMAGVTDLPFRQLCVRFGAGLATSEMLTSDISLWQSKKSSTRLKFLDGTTPVSMQIAGSEPSMLAEAAARCEELGAHIVDINMGCPAKKVCKKLAGSALLRDEKLVASILQTVVDRVSIPVTLKTRTGWDNDHKNVSRIAKIAEDTGIKALTIHGRTRACRFNGNAEYDTIANVVSQVAIPVIANGDICNGEQAQQVLDYTGAQAVMIGRAALGRPWLFRNINQKLSGQVTRKHPEIEEIKSVMIEHLQNLHTFYGEQQGVRIARKHVGWYCENITQGQTLRKQFNTLDKPGSQLRAVVNHFERYKRYEDIAA